MFGNKNGPTIINFHFNLNDNLIFFGIDFFVMMVALVVVLVSLNDFVVML